MNQLQAPGNTKSVGWTGLLVGIASIVAPTVAQHLGASPDIVQMLQSINAYFTGGGLVAAYLGMPFTVKGA